MTAAVIESRYAIDASTLVRVVADGLAVAPLVQLVAPGSIRSDALAIVLRRVQSGDLADSDAQVLHERMTQLRIRVLSDRVSRWTAFRLARDHGWATLHDAECIAVARLQADALVTVNEELAARARGIVQVHGVERLSR